MAKSKSQIPLLDVFILALVRDGVNTLYRLLQDVGISVGAASPSVRRLLEKDFIARPRIRAGGKYIVEARRKLAYQMSLFGCDFLDSDWIASFEANMPTDTESVARLVALAESEGKPDVAVNVLKNAIATRRQRARRTLRTSDRSKIAARYRSILQACESARLKAEATALRKILAGLT